MSRKLARLFDEYKPDVLLLKEPGNRISRCMNMIATLAAANHIRLCTISGESIKRTLPQRIQNKHQMAQAVADHFPLLSSYVPPKRKPWKGEHYRTSVFEAAALGLTYFASRPLATE